jgi:hypothetical protein
MRSLFCLALFAVAVVIGGSGSAQATTDPTTNPGLQRVLGMVPPLHAATKAGGFGTLRYHNGPVMHTNKVYAIYWVPAGGIYGVDSTYRSTIDRYFSDVAAATVADDRNNVYYTSTQYYDAAGYVGYSSTFAGSAVDSNPLPPSGCTDSYTSVCLSDAQIQAELKKVIAAQAWTANSSTEFFMFTPKGVGSCSGSSCAFSDYCAYHSWMGSGATATLYSNMPYADTVPAACDVGQHPNGGDADATLNVTSHEHNETITDEQGNAWYDLAGYENGDKCAWKFGTVSGPSGAQYNQTINGNHYWLQLEYSNAQRGCVQSGL